MKKCLRMVFQGYGIIARFGDIEIRRTDHIDRIKATRQNAAHKVPLLSLLLLFALFFQRLADALESLAEVGKRLFLDCKPEDCKTSDSCKQQRGDYDARNRSARKSVLFENQYHPK